MLARAGRWTLEQARQDELEYLRKVSAPLALVWLIALSTSVVVNVAVHGWLGGFVAGLVVAAVTAGSIVAVRDSTGTAPRRMGAMAEGWTSAELRKQLNGASTVFDHVSFDHFDVDHVVIGSGGVFAVETKWSATPWQLSPANNRALRDAHQARRGAEKIALLLHSADVKVDISVQPLLVLWGKLAAGSGVERRVDGIEVIHGHHLAAWCASHRTDVVPQEVTTRAAEGIRQFVRKRDIHDQRIDTRGQWVTGGLDALSQRAVATMLMACGGMIAALAVLALHTTMWLTLPLTASLGTLGMIARRRKALHLPALGWTTGVAVGALCGLAWSQLL